MWTEIKLTSTWLVLTWFSMLLWGSVNVIGCNWVTSIHAEAMQCIDTVVKVTYLEHLVLKNNISKSIILILVDDKSWIGSIVSLVKFKKVNNRSCHFEINVSINVNFLKSNLEPGVETIYFTNNYIKLLLFPNVMKAGRSVWVMQQTNKQTDKVPTVEARPIILFNKLWFKRIFRNYMELDGYVGL